MARAVRLAMIALLAGSFLGCGINASAQMDGRWQIREVDYCPEWVGGTSLAFDSAGFPHVSYTEHGDMVLKYAWKNASGWYNMTLAFTGSSTITSLALTKRDKARISYRGLSGELVFIIQNPSGWDFKILDSGSSGWWGGSDLQLDGHDRPHICYWDGTTNELRYGYLSGPSPYDVWVTSVVDTTDNRECSLALGADGYPHISYFNAALEGQVMYAHKDAGGWHRTMVDSEPSSAEFIPSETSIALSCDGTPAIVYSQEIDRQKANLVFAVKGPRSAWYRTTLESGAETRDASLALQSCPDAATSYFGVSYNNEETNELRYAWQDSAGWHKTTVDKGGWEPLGPYNSLAYKNPSSPSISYRYGTSLMYARYVPKPIVLPGLSIPPTDPDGDGIYEDLNGNGRLDFADVVLYFNEMEWITDNEPIEAFDLNDNNRIDFADVLALFNEI